MEMVVYLDELAALNFLIDYLLLSAAAGLCSVYASRLRRMAAALLGAAYACAAFLFPALRLDSAIGKTAALVSMVLCAFGFGSAGRFVRRCLTFALCAALFAGFSLFMSGAGLSRMGGVLYADIPGTVILALCACAYILLDAVLRYSFQTAEERPRLVRVRICRGGREAEFCALRDTGNRLRDPIGGERVMVCELSALEPVLSLPERSILESAPDGAAALEALVKAGLGRGFRLMPYRSLGTDCGLLPALRPEEVYIEGKRQRGVLLAVARAPFERDAPYRAVI